MMVGAIFEETTTSLPTVAPRGDGLFAFMMTTDSKESVIANPPLADVAISMN